MKILHFSDVHWGNSHWWRILEPNKRFFGRLTQIFLRHSKQDLGILPRLIEYAHAQQPDLAICTGDLTSVAAPEEFQRAESELSKLLPLCAAGMVYVPGNHDAYVNDSKVRQALAHAKAVLNVPGENGTPLIRRFGNVTVYILDAACPLVPWLSGGRLGKRSKWQQCLELLPHTSTLQQNSIIQKLEKELSKPRMNGEIRILASHFPVYKRDGNRLDYRKRLREDLAVRSWVDAGYLDYCLCGHIHKPYIWHNAGGTFTQVCAGSLTLSGNATLLDTEKKTCDLIKL